jgi:hypothetical protein
MRIKEAKDLLEAEVDVLVELDSSVEHNDTNIISTFYHSS